MFGRLCWCLSADLRHPVLEIMLFVGGDDPHVAHLPAGLTVQPALVLVRPMRWTQLSIAEHHRRRQGQDHSDGIGVITYEFSV